MKSSISFIFALIHPVNPALFPQTLSLSVPTRQTLSSMGAASASQTSPPPQKRRRRARAPPPIPALPADPLAAYSLCTALPTGAGLRCVAGPALTPAESSWALRGLEAALRPSYGGTGLAWSTAEKRRELRAGAQRILLAADGDAAPLAFVSFRVDQYEGGADGEAAIYVYEVFVDERARRRGLARALMGVVLEVARAAAVGRIVLTVLDCNESAILLYKGIGFVADKSCPSRHGNAEAKYQILCKDVCG